MKVSSVRRGQTCGGRSAVRCAGVIRPFSELNRLTSYAEPGASQGFGYDGFGNVWQRSNAGVPALRANSSAWYLVQTSPPVVTNRLANTGYDQAGNQ